MMVHTDNNQPTFEDLELLAEVSQLLTVVDLDRVMHEVIRLSAQAVGADKASLFLHEDDHVDWEHVITMRNLSHDESVKVVTRVLDEGFAGWAYRNKRGDIIDDVLEDVRWIVFPDDPPNQRSALCVPMVDDDKVIAVLTLVHSAPYHFKPFHLRLATIIANQATIALRNAQLFNRLNSQRRQLSAILQAVGDVLLALDEYGRIVEVNERGLWLLDARHLDDVVGHYIGDFLMVDDVLKPIVAVVEQDVIAEDRWEFDTRSERRKKDFNVTMTIWQEALRDKAGFVVVMHDVTQVYDLSRFKDEMLRIASHDLRSPLALIAGYADLASIDTAEATSPVHEYMNIVKNTTEKMGILVDDLLRVERVRSNPLELHEQVDLNGLLKVVNINTKPLIEAKGLKFIYDVHLDGAPRIMADKVLLRQAMENLVANAVKYTLEGSITLRAHVEGERFHFIVEDTGIGISQEDLPYIFESFYRANNRNMEKGNGLGLSLVKNVITRHNGEIWVKSDVGVGSRFGFWLPLQQTPDD